MDEEDPDPVDEADPLVDPLQVISDPSFPPFPVLGETTLTKPNNVLIKSQTTKGNINKNRVETTTTTMTTTSTTTQKPLDWRKG